MLNMYRNYDSVFNIHVVLLGCLQGKFCDQSFVKTWYRIAGVTKVFPHAKQCLLLLVNIGVKI